QHIMARLAQRYAAEGTKTGFDTAAELFRHAPGALERERLLAGIAEAFKGGQFANTSPALRNAIASVGSKAKPQILTLKLRLGAANAEETARVYQTLQNDDEKLKTQRIE